MVVKTMNIWNIFKNGHNFLFPFFISSILITTSFFMLRYSYTTYKIRNQGCPIECIITSKNAHTTHVRIDNNEDLYAGETEDRYREGQTIDVYYLKGEKRVVQSRISLSRIRFWMILQSLVGIMGVIIWFLPIIYKNKESHKS